MNNEKGMTIVRLEVANVKKIKVVEIQPDGSPMVVIGGRNGQGKSSVLDAITFALAGKRSLPPRPVRDGASKAAVLVDLGDIVVRRSMTAEGGGTLTVTAKDGQKLASPQAVLDRLCAELTFDPLEFSRMKPRDRAETLRKMTGLDFDALDARKAELLAERGLAQREAKLARAMAGDLPVFCDVPEQEVSVEDLLAELDRRREVNGQNAAHREALERAALDLSSLLEEEAQLQERLAAVGARIRHERANLEEMGSVELIDRETDEIVVQIKAAGEINRLVAANRRAEESLSAAERAEAMVLATQLQLESIDREREERLAAVDLPVKGLAFDGDGVTFLGVPFEQCSQAEQLKVSVALGLSMHKEVRVLLIREGAVLDEESLAMVARMAAKRDAQVWVERVGKGEEVQVIIENGVVVEQRDRKVEVA